MYIDMIHYTLAEGVTEQELAKAAEDIHTAWMSKQPGFLKWEIGTRASDGKGLDLVYWASKEAAEAATAAMKDIPEGHPWMSCYDMNSITSEKLQITKTIS